MKFASRTWLAWALGTLVAFALATPCNAQQSTVTDLGTLPGLDWSEPSGINASGQVVGDSFSPGPPIARRAFLWSEGGMSDLNSLIPPDSGWVLNVASAIKRCGSDRGLGLAQ